MGVQGTLLAGDHAMPSKATLTMSHLRAAGGSLPTAAELERMSSDRGAGAWTLGHGQGRIGA